MPFCSPCCFSAVCFNPEYKDHLRQGWGGLVPAQTYSVLPILIEDPSTADFCVWRAPVVHQELMCHHPPVSLDFSHFLTRENKWFTQHVLCSCKSVVADCLLLYLSPYNWTKNLGKWACELWLERGMTLNEGEGLSSDKHMVSAGFFGFRIWIILNLTFCFSWFS